MQSDLDVCFQQKIEFLEEENNFYIQLPRHKTPRFTSVVIYDALKKMVF